MTNQNTSKTRTVLIFGVAAALVILAGVAAIFISGGNDADPEAGAPTADGSAAVGISEIRPVAITGDPLPAMPEQGTDVALGSPMPELSGQSFDGTPVEIKNDGRPKIILFLTHW
ncbi:MAG: hypothetical protein P1T08_18510 [Acidimicrobiia bacterium]|nr:hypothetical protein [Acidimicrobiia bacterium]